MWPASPGDARSTRATATRTSGCGCVESAATLAMHAASSNADSSGDVRVQLVRRRIRSKPVEQHRSRRHRVLAQNRELMRADRRRRGGETVDDAEKKLASAWLRRQAVAAL